MSGILMAPNINIHNEGWDIISKYNNGNRTFLIQQNPSNNKASFAVSPADDTNKYYESFACPIVSNDISDSHYYDIVTTKTLLNQTYPIGAIYISTVSTSPASLFGGTWEMINGKFLLAGQSTTYPYGSVGGASTVKLTQNQMPAHVHEENYDFGGQYVRPMASLTQQSGTTQSTASTNGTYKYFTNYLTFTSASTDHPVYPIITQSMGGSQAHDNMPPYLAVYMWKRID